ncbi:MAG TPA: alpha-2-macroglobulin, partial [Anaerolineae bacterium]|nr:alpha-2-macroglobulin [Anaerolineae bacterium]
THPLLLERSPARGEEAPLDRALTLIFDQPMDPASVEAAFFIEPAVEGAFSWPDPATLVFIPRAGWERATRYRVELSTAAKSVEGVPLREEVDFTFATVGYLEVTQVIPEPGTVDVEPDGAVTVMFNRPVVPLRLVSLSAPEMPPPLQFDPPVEGAGEWVNTSIYVFRPDTGFTPGRTYRATIPAGLADTTGGVLESDFTWTFTIQAPTILQTEPADGEDLVPLTQPITVTFSQPMDPVSTQAAFSLGPPVEGTFSWSEDSTVMTFLPDGLLPLDTRYTVRIGRTARAAVGDATLEEEYTWTFETVPYPRILRTEPADETLADPDISLEIYFSAPMDVATLMPHITILPEPTQVYTYWASRNNRLLLSWDIQPSTDYEVHLGEGMADPYGNTLGEDQVVRFTTRPLNPLAYLAVPGNVGTYNAYTATQIYLLHRNVSRVDLALYRLDWQDFLRLTGPDRWDMWDRFNPATQAELLREWSLDAEAPLNESRYLRVDLSGRASVPA